MMNFLRKRPWLIIVFAFVILIVSWTVLLRIASKYRPETVELAPPVTHEP